MSAAVHASALLGFLIFSHDAHGDKVRTLQLRAAGTIGPTSLFFTRDGRLLVTPGCYEFNPNGR